MKSTDRDIVVSTRVRLARSLDGLLFPSKMSPEDALKLDERIQQRINKNDDFKVYLMQSLGSTERQVLVERHLASAALVNKPNAMLLLNQDESISILVGEEDHVRIQCILEGLSLDKADELTRSVDAIIAAEGYAFDDKLGYLTACPTNVGTGMRASAMLHLPALTLTGQIRNITDSVNKFGCTIRGYYGEGSNADGDMVQISNQVTLGISEDEILISLLQVLRAVMDKERQLRDGLLKNDKGELTDRLYRSLGILKYARRLSTKEMMQRLSDIRLGLSLNLFEGISYDELETLATNMQPASLSASLAQSGGEDRDKARAKAVRIALKDCHY